MTVLFQFLLQVFSGFNTSHKLHHNTVLRLLSSHPHLKVDKAPHLSLQLGMQLDLLSTTSSGHIHS